MPSIPIDDAVGFGAEVQAFLNKYKTQLIAKGFDPTTVIGQIEADEADLLTENQNQESFKTQRSNQTVVVELAPGRAVTSSAELGKVQSAKPVSSQAEHGNFYIVRHDGWERTRAQMIDFPYGDHDDLMDAISRALAAHVHTPEPQQFVGGWTISGWAPS